MLGDNFVKYLKSTSPRHMTRLDLFLNFLSIKIKEGQVRAVYSPYSSYGVRVLTEVIKLADLSIILSPSFNMRNLSSYLLSIENVLEQPIDPRLGRNTPRALFIKSRQKCLELFIPSRRLNPLYSIPIGSDYSNSQWENIRPLRIVDMGIADLTFKIFDARLDYYNRGPDHVIYTLDCIALVAKFISYYKSQKIKYDVDAYIDMFIHNEIVIPTLLNDSVSVWLRNIYRSQFVTNSRLESLTTTNWDNIDVDTLGTEFSGAMVDIMHLKNDLIQQSISPIGVLSSLLLTPSRLSFTDYYRELYETTQMSDQQPYIWADGLKNISWWEFIIMMCSLAPNRPDVVSYQRNLIRDVRFWMMMKPYNEVPNSFPYRQSIKIKLEGMYEYLKTV